MNYYACGDWSIAELSLTGSVDWDPHNPKYSSQIYRHIHNNSYLICTLVCRKGCVKYMETWLYTIIMYFCTVCLSSHSFNILNEETHKDPLDAVLFYLMHFTLHCKVLRSWPYFDISQCTDHRKAPKKLCHRRRANTEGNSCEFCTDHANCCRLCKVIIW